MANKLTVQDRVRCISFPPKRGISFKPGQAEETMTLFSDVLTREKWDFSTGVWYAVAEYVERHSPGNPAQSLARFFEGKDAYRAPKGRCQLPRCPNLAVGYAKNRRTGARVQLCRNHLRDSLKNGWVKDE